MLKSTKPIVQKYHSTSIKIGIESLIKAIYGTKYEVRLFILLNESRVQNSDSADIFKGVGRQTKESVSKIASSHPFISVESIEYSDSMNVKGYNYLLKKIHRDDRFAYISVFADDYIVPTHWVDIVLSEFRRHKGVDFIMPSTSYVAQKRLLVPFSVKGHWELNTRNGSVFGVKKGVRIADVNEISLSCRDFKMIRYKSPPSFETTVFSRKCVDKFGYLHEGYYSRYWNTEYFDNMSASLVNGYISRKSFIFHHGKGGTSSLFKEGDEKFKGSSVEQKVIDDAVLYNKRNNKNIVYQPPSPEGIYKKRLPSKEEIIDLMKYYDRQDIWRRIWWSVRYLLK